MEVRSLVLGSLIMMIAIPEAHSKVPKMLTIDNGTSWMLIGSPGAVDLDFEKGLVFWIEELPSRIQRAKTDTSNHTVDNSSIVTLIHTDIFYPRGLSVDWLNEKLYWTDYGRNTVEVCTFTGDNRKVLYRHGVFHPSEIVADPIHGYLFWVESRVPPCISRAGMDGTNSSRSLVLSSHHAYISGLAIDPHEQKIFWTFMSIGELWVCGYSGNDRQLISIGAQYVTGMTLFNGQIIWASRASGENVIYRHDYSNNSNITKIDLGGDTWASDVAILQPPQTSRVNPCGGGNGGCSELCLISPDKPFYRCACETGIKLKEDNLACEDGPQQQLLFAQRVRLGRISLDTDEFTPMTVPVDINHNISHLVDVAYDPIDEYMYWTDEGKAGIRRAYLNGTGSETLFTINVSYPDGIAVDFIHRCLYWTDRGTGTVEMSSLNGEHRQIIIQEGLDQPRAIAVDPVKMFLFWTDWGKQPKIERSRLHGTERRVLVDKGLKWPNGITRDFSENRLYWADGAFDVIESINIEGSGRKLVVGTGLSHVFGLTLLGDYIYWSDWRGRSIERAHKHTGMQRTVLIHHLRDIYGLTAFDTKLVCPPGTYGTGCGLRCGICLEDEPCDRKTGRCINGCGKGVLSDPDNRCITPCPGGTFAEDCSRACGQCKLGVTCDRRTGNCPYGCRVGYTGTTCHDIDKHAYKNHKNLSGASAIVSTLIISIVVVIFILLVSIAVYCWRKRRSARTQVRAEDTVKFITEMEEEFRL